MKNFRDIIDLWPSRSAFAKRLSVPNSTASSMWQNDTIPSQYWVDVVAGAVERGHGDVTFEMLAGMAKAKRGAMQGV